MSFGFKIFHILFALIVMAHVMSAFFNQANTTPNKMPDIFHFWDVVTGFCISKLWHHYLKFIG